MTTTMESQTGRERRTLYIVIAVVVGVLMVVALFAFRSAKSTREAEEKADQLIAAIEEAARQPRRATRSCACSATMAGPPAPTRTRR